MPRRPVRLARLDDGLRDSFSAIRAEIGVPEAFPAEVLIEAERAAVAPRAPDADRTDVPFVTIDPPTSLDLDQALHLDRHGDGFRVRYAIADAAAFVEPGGLVDAEAHRRGETAYSPDLRSPLYPPILSEARASLLPDGPRPALVWQLDVDGDGDIVDTHVERAMVRSRAKLSYIDVQRSIEAASADASLDLLPEIGRLLQDAERARGGASLGLPRQEVVRGDDGFELRFEAPLPVERWNAQISLLTGRAAARLMMQAGVGVLRTMPPPEPRDVARLRRVARALRVEWPDGMRYGDLLHAVDAGRSRNEAVFVQEAAVLFRGASYTSFDGEVPAEPIHAAIASPYAHCTAPLRRLVDRYALETCLALCEDRPVPGWVLEALPALPAEMAVATERHNRLERTIVDVVEAAVLTPHVGRESDAVVVDLWKRNRGEVALTDAAVIGPCDDVHELAAEVRVRLEEADIATRTIRFVRVRSEA
ncbi:MAG TPA: RNB domain-containing ribonuclease [Actinomycetota bacterium]|nr:RNB domain-containing ribonuclease [Actinomycetota bacterium]